MGFHDTRFPEELNYGSVGGPYFQTQVSTTDAGYEQRISRWQQVRHKYNLQMDLTWELGQQLRDFYIGRQGAAHSFRFKDYMDFRTPVTGYGEDQGGAAITPEDQEVGTGDGSTTQFQLVKRYTSGPVTRVRNITKPIEGTVQVAIGGVEQTSGGWSVDYSTGILTFSTAPVSGSVTWGGEFDVECRFSESADSLLGVRWRSFGSVSIQNLELVEVMSQDFPSDEIYYGGSKEETIDADKPLSWSSEVLQVLTPNGADRSIFFPEPDTNSPHSGGPFFTIVNASGSQDLITPVNTIAPGEAYSYYLLITDAGHQWYAV